MKMEWRRIRKSSGFWLAICLGIILVVWHMQDSLLFYYKENQSLIHGNSMPPYNVFSMWLPLSIVGSSPGIMVTLVYLLVPLIAALPYGNSLIADRQSGYLKGMITRMDRKKVYRCRYVMIFLSGGAVTVFPFLLDFFVCRLYFPYYEMVPGRSYSINCGNALLGEIFAENPVLYVTLSMLLLFLFGGLWACMVPVFRGIVENRFLVMLCPFIAGYFIQTALEAGGAFFWRFEPRIVMLGNYATTWGCVFIDIAIFIVLIYVFGYRREVRDDVF